jgi:bifunctional non-homologous end joining protein LigD
MAATLTEKRFEGPEWTFERKLDGIRLLAFKQRRDVRLFSRNRLPQHNPQITDAIAALPARDLILDGEVTGVWGPASTRAADRPRGLAYHVFDILWLDGRDLMPLPLTERRAVLGALSFHPPLEHVDALEGAEPWERACREGWEGVIAKRRNSKYEQRSASSWSVALPIRKADGSDWAPSLSGITRAASSCLRGRSALVLIRSCSSNCVRALMPSSSRRRRSHGPWACRASVPIGSSL